MYSYVWYRPGAMMKMTPNELLTANTVRRMFVAQKREYDHYRLAFGEGAKLTQDAKQRLKYLENQFVEPHVVGDLTRDYILSTREYDI